MVVVVVVMMGVDGVGVVGVGMDVGVVVVVGEGVAVAVAGAGLLGVVTNEVQKQAWVGTSVGVVVVMSSFPSSASSSSTGFSSSLLRLLSLEVWWLWLLSLLFHSRGKAVLSGTTIPSSFSRVACNSLIGSSSSIAM